MIDTLANQVQMVAPFDIADQSLVQILLLHWCFMKHGCILFAKCCALVLLLPYFIVLLAIVFCFIELAKYACGWSS
jgi:hypothetical protein